MGEIRNAYKIAAVTPERKTPVARLNIKMNLEIYC
jgi:hypothetical protein